ncbi:MAG: sialate O-acetylesterase [Verrucomicrobiia bacterium]
MKVCWHFILHMAVCLVAASATDALDVRITREGNIYHVNTARYEAHIADDGCLTNLLVGGLEFFKADIGSSRGSYFHQGEPLKLPKIEQSAENVIVAKSNLATIRYEFAANSMVWSVENNTSDAMKFFIIFDPEVSPEKGEIRGTVLSHEGATSTWFRDKARLAIDGGTRFWGPWRGCMMWDAALAAREKRQITFKIGTASEAEAIKMGAAPVPMVEEVEQDLTLLSPKNFQVFQRQARFRGRIIVSGRVKPECDAVEARLSGKSLEGRWLPNEWLPVPLEKITQRFYAEMPTPAGGWYALQVRALKENQPVAKAGADKVGVGEVFVGAGQSNITNSGQERTTQTSGMVASFGGNHWQLADDPQPGVHDTTRGGSFWPTFGDAMYARFRVPIGIAVTGRGGTSVYAWKPGGDLYNWTMIRILQLGPNGFRALLWHQGEADVGGKPEDYAQNLTGIVRASTATAGWQFPWFVAQVSYLSPERPSSETTRSAQKQLWDRGIALQGPDTDTLTNIYRDNEGKGIHLNRKGIVEHGKMWAEKIGDYLYKVLAQETK